MWAIVLTVTLNPVFFGLLLGLPFLVLTFVGILRSRKMARRIQKMTQMIRRHEQGELTERLPADEDDDLGILASAVNGMSHSFKRKTARLENEKSKLSSILSHMVEGVFAVDANLEILIANPSAEAILNLPAKSLLGKSLLQITHDPKAEEVMRDAVNRQTSRLIEFELDYPAHKMLRANAVGFPGGESEVCGIFVFYDVTEIRKLETTRREFVSNVSHELRTPLTSIKGFLETLLSQAPDPEHTKRFLKMAAEDTERLTRLIDDLLELSNIESKPHSLKLQEADLKQEVEKAAVIFEPRLADKKINLENRIPNGFPPLLADTDKLRQVLINLLDNAVKFNKQGGSITISAKLREGCAEISIADTGRGISPDTVEHIFERFYRADKSRSREENRGSGLGLAIVKHILEAHGGSIQCRSKRGEGSVFSFTLKTVST